MKTITKVSIGKCAFSIEEDAYQVIYQYLNDLTLYYNDKPSGNEIIEGIEERIAELFIEKSNNNNITKNIVEEVIAIIGNPSLNEEDAVLTDQPQQNKTKKLYRNINNRVFGGVCSGFATYFNVDVSLIRVVYAILAIFFATLDFEVFDIEVGGILFFVYALLWILIPKADTVEKRYAMQGKALNASSLENDIQSGVDEVNTNGNIITTICSIILLIAGFGGLIFGLGMSYLFVELDQNLLYSHFHFNSEMIKLIQSLSTSTTLIISAILTYFLPFIWMIYAGIIGLFRLNAPKWRPGLVLLLIWILTLFTGIFSVIPDIINAFIV